MKRSIGMLMAIVLLAFSLSAVPAKAYYHPYHHRPSNGGGNMALALIGGFVAGAVVGAVLSSSDRGAMNRAYPEVYGRDVEDGYRAEFEGDGHRGYYEVVNQGHHPEYNRCRQIRTVVYDRYRGGYAPGFQRRPRCVCLNERANRWVDVDEEDYRVRPRVQISINRRPYGSHYYASPMVRVPVARPLYNVRPMYPSYGPVYSSYGSMYGGGARPFPGHQFGAPLTAPAYGGFNRTAMAPYPSQSAPQVLPLRPQAFR